MRPMTKQLLWLCLAGAGGTCCRVAFANLVQRASGVSFPWGTWAVNGVGCFLFGLIWTVADQREWLSGETRFVLLAGFLGAFTTFSTLAFETTIYWKNGAYFSGLSNVLGQNLLGFACVWLGFWMAQK